MRRPLSKPIEHRDAKPVSRGVVAGVVPVEAVAAVVMALLLLGALTFVNFFEFSALLANQPKSEVGNILGNAQKPVMLKQGQRLLEKLESKSEAKSEPRDGQRADTETEPSIVKSEPVIELPRMTTAPVAPPPAPAPTSPPVVTATEPALPPVPTPVVAAPPVTKPNPIETFIRMFGRRSDPAPAPVVAPAPMRQPALATESEPKAVPARAAPEVPTAPVSASPTEVAAAPQTAPRQPDTPPVAPKPPAVSLPLAVPQQVAIAVQPAPALQLPPPQPVVAPDTTAWAEFLRSEHDLQLVEVASPVIPVMVVPPVPVAPPPAATLPETAPFVAVAPPRRRGENDRSGAKPAHIDCIAIIEQAQLGDLTPANRILLQRYCR